MMQERFFISCPKGVEVLLEEEFEGLGFTNIRQTVGGIYASAEFSRCYHACLFSRLANRVVWLLLETDAKVKEDLYRAVNDIVWSACFSLSKTFSVDFRGTNDLIQHSNYGALLIKDAVVDHFSAEYGERPNVQAKGADVRLYAHVRRQKVMLGVDISGGSLHRRGYRLEGAKAPLKENLAAALVKRMPAVCDTHLIVDPMCGSGTLLIEALFQRLNIPSQLHRESYGFEHLLRFKPALWHELLSQARIDAAERIKQAKVDGVKAYGYDFDMRAIASAKTNAQRAGVADLIEFKSQALKDFQAFDRPGVLLCNPPYGERLDERNELFSLYQDLGQMIKRDCQGWKAAVLSSDDHLLKAMALQKSKSYQFYNGAIAAQWLLFEIYKKSEEFAEIDKADDKFIQAVEMVANRLRKNKKKLQKWANKNAIDCYRVYDADMPEYAFALDNYQGVYQLTEYAAPKTIDSFAAFSRKKQFETAVLDVFELKTSQLFFKERKQQKGSSQYEKISESKHFFKVQEGAATVWVNLRDYLDTGLFLDHRPVRKMLGEKAQNKSFLNLFSYTSVASVQAILAGAASSTSVDMSQTYISWSEKNFQSNGIDLKKHQLVRANVIEWLAANSEKFDLIFLDPPSFSNSKRMDGTLDIQRDQQQLVTATMQSLAVGGELIFSNNRKGFKLDQALLDAYMVEDISRKTIDVDFERNAKIHQCWSIKHRA